MIIKKIEDLHELSNGKGGLSLLVTYSDKFIDIYAEEEETVIATLDAERLSLQEIVKMLKEVWQFDVEVNEKYSYFISFIIYNKFGSSRQECDSVIGLKHKIKTIEDTNEIKKSIKKEISLDAEDTIILRNVYLLD